MIGHPEALRPDRATDSNRHILTASIAASSCLENPLERSSLTSRAAPSSPTSPRNRTSPLLAGFSRCLGTGKQTAHAGGRLIPRCPWLRLCNRHALPVGTRERQGAGRQDSHQTRDNQQVLHLRNNSLSGQVGIPIFRKIDSSYQPTASGIHSRRHPPRGETRPCAPEAHGMNPRRDASGTPPSSLASQPGEPYRPVFR